MAIMLTYRILIICKLLIKAKLTLGLLAFERSDDFGAAIIAIAKAHLSYRFMLLYDIR